MCGQPLKCDRFSCINCVKLFKIKISTKHRVNWFSDNKGLTFCLQCSQRKVAANSHAKTTGNGTFKMH